MDKIFNRIALKIPKRYRQIHPRFANYEKDLSSPTISHSLSHNNANSTQNLEGVSVAGYATSSVADNDGDMLNQQYAAAIGENVKKGYVPKMFDVWCLVMTTVLYGIYYGWNLALVAGFGSFFIGQFLMGIAYICFAFCLAEIVSTTSFSGGAYGMARVVLGFYPGFIVASFELMEYLTYASSAIYWFAEFVVARYEWDHVHVITICIISYILLGLLLMEQNYIFWRVNYILAISTLLILLIYIFGSLKFTHFSAYAPLEYAPTDDDGYYYSSGTMGNSSSSNTTTVDDSMTEYYSRGSVDAWFHGGMPAFFQLLPYATYGFAGIECAALVTDVIENPRVNLSYGIAISVVTLFVVMMVMLFVAASLPPGMNDFCGADYFMDAGWNLMGVSSEVSQWLVIPTQLAMAFGFSIPCFKLVNAMANSHLLPPYLGLQNKNNYAAIVFSMTASFLTCLIPYYFPDVYLGNVATIFACFTYLSDLYAYYKMKTDFSSRDHKFTNPFGIPGAVFAACMFILTIISLLGYQIDYSTGYAVILYLGLLTVYYYLYAKKFQQFSDDEQKTLLVLHVMGNNKRKRNIKQRKMWVNINIKRTNKDDVNSAGGPNNNLDDGAVSIGSRSGNRLASNNSLGGGQSYRVNHERSIRARSVRSVRSTGSSNNGIVQQQQQTTTSAPPSRQSRFFMSNLLSATGFVTGGEQSSSSDVNNHAMGSISSGVASPSSALGGGVPISPHPQASSLTLLPPALPITEERDDNELTEIVAPDDII